MLQGVPVPQKHPTWFHMLTTAPVANKKQFMGGFTVNLLTLKS
jgi:hypothetical protein